MPRSAIEILDDPKYAPQVKPLPDGTPWGPLGAPMLISTPREIYVLMASVPKGKVLVVNDMRSYLAQKHAAAVTCPLTTGIFINICSRAAEEFDGLGRERIAWWRTVKKDGLLNEKAPGGVKAHYALLENEGHSFAPKGKSNWRVSNLEHVRYLPE